MKKVAFVTMVTFMALMVGALRAQESSRGSISDKMIEDLINAVTPQADEATRKVQRSSIRAFFGSQKGYDDMQRYAREAADGSINSGDGANRKACDQPPSDNECVCYVSPNGKFMLVTRGLPSAQAMASRTWDERRGCWGEAIPLRIPGAGEWAGHPCLAPDGSTVIFGAPQLGTARTKLQNGDWSNPAWSTPESIFGNDRHFSWFAFNGKELYMSQSGISDCRVYVSRYDPAADSFSVPKVVDAVALQSGHSSPHPWISADGRLLIFSSDCSGGCGGYDLFSATRSKAGDSWAAARNLGPGINTPKDETYGQIAEGVNLLFLGNTTLHRVLPWGPMRPEITNGRERLHGSERVSALRCSSCGKLNELDSGFCQGCGGKL